MNNFSRTPKSPPGLGKPGGSLPSSPPPETTRPDAPPQPKNWDGFLLLPENRSAARATRAVCRAVRAGKRPLANPLVLHGPHGTGKSRLLAAAAGYVANGPRGTVVRVVSVGDLTRSPDETFADHDLFDCDLLALEDVQHLAERFSDAACDLLDRRAAHRRATVVTANAGPAGLTHLPHRLTSRLAAGLVVQLEPLAAPGRLAILTAAAPELGVRLTPDALEWLAGHAAGGGVRAALGSLRNLALVARSFPGPMTRADVEQTLTQTGQPTSAAADVSVIVKRVAAALGVTEPDLLGTSRHRTVMRARQLAMYLARAVTGWSLPRLGAAFGRDHTTVLHGCRKVEEEMVSDPALAKQVSELRGALR